MTGLVIICLHVNNTQRLISVTLYPTDVFRVSGMMSGTYGPVGSTAAPTAGPPNDISGLIQA